ncbi:MAG: hypothetical protein HN796_15680 [Gemmatimonadetes bacterium]|nr:hypothetical protein [Gemmatimonadota bacterium]
MADVLGVTIADVIHELGPYPSILLLQEMGWAVFHNGSRIGRTGYRSPVDIRAVSGGGEIGWQVERIMIDGVQVSKMGRGYNLVAINPSTGEVLQSHKFDTRALWGLEEGRTLADTLAALPQGVIVIGTANHGARRGLPRRAWFELHKIGVRELPSVWGSHAFIGIKGAMEPGEEDLCDIGIAHVGVVAPNIDPDVVADPHRLETFLRSKAMSTPSGVSVYLAGYHRGDSVTVAVGSRP